MALLIIFCGMIKSHNYLSANYILVKSNKFICEYRTIKLILYTILTKVQTIPGKKVTPVNLQISVPQQIQTVTDEAEIWYQRC